MAGNVIYRGPIAKQPQTISNRTVAGAYLPGVLVTDSGTVLTIATAADMGEKVYVLANRDFYDQDVATAYASGDTGVAYEALPGEVYQVRLAAATYAKGEKLTLTASGYLTNVIAGGNVTYAYFSDTAGARTAGDLADVIWAGAGGTEPDGT
mgnify:CR=1 FL=1